MKSEGVATSMTSLVRPHLDDDDDDDDDDHGDGDEEKEEVRDPRTLELQLVGLLPRWPRSPWVTPCRAGSGGFRV